MAKLAKLNSVRNNLILNHSFIFGLLMISFSTCLREKAIHSVTVIRAQILHDYEGYGYPPNSNENDPNPILHVELDIGSVCLLAMHITGRCSFKIAGEPECTGNLCGGPVGPIKIWTKVQVTKSIIECISFNLKPNESLSNYTVKEFKDRFNLGRDRHVIGCGSKPERVMPLKIDDENEKISAVLTDEYSHLQLYWKKVGNSRIVVIEIENVYVHSEKGSTMSVSLIYDGDEQERQMDLTFTKQYEQNLNCLVDKQPWLLSEDEVRTETLVCFTKYITATGMNLRSRKRSEKQSPIEEILREEL